MPPRHTLPTDAVLRLGLPQNVARGLTRSLDRYLRSRSIGHHPLRNAVYLSSATLALQGQSVEIVAESLAAAVAGHAEERGHGVISVVSGVPRYHALCDLVRRWVRESFDGRRPPPRNGRRAATPLVESDGPEPLGAA